MTGKGHGISESSKPLGDRLKVRFCLVEVLKRRKKKTPLFQRGASISICLTCSVAKTVKAVASEHGDFTFAERMAQGDGVRNHSIGFRLRH